VAQDSLTFGLDPDAALVRQAALGLADLLTVFCVLHGDAKQVEVLGIDGLLVEYLIEFYPSQPPGYL